MSNFGIPVSFQHPIQWAMLALVIRHFLNSFPRRKHGPSQFCETLTYVLSKFFSSNSWNRLGEFINTLQLETAPMAFEHVWWENLTSFCSLFTLGCFQHAVKL